MTRRVIPAPVGLTAIRSARMRVTESILRIDLTRQPHDVRPLLLVAVRELQDAEQQLLRAAPDDER